MESIARQLRFRFGFGLVRNVRMKPGSDSRAGLVPEKTTQLSIRTKVRLAVWPVESAIAPAIEEKLSDKMMIEDNFQGKNVK